jgi:hypothetical protein
MRSQYVRTSVDKSTFTWHPRPPKHNHESGKSTRNAPAETIYLPSHPRSYFLFFTHANRSPCFTYRISFTYFNSFTYPISVTYLVIPLSLPPPMPWTTYLLCPCQMAHPISTIDLEMHYSTGELHRLYDNLDHCLSERHYEQYNPDDVTETQRSDAADMIETRMRIWLLLDGMVGLEGRAALPPVRMATPPLRPRRIRRGGGGFIGVRMVVRRTVVMTGLRYVWSCVGGTDIRTYGGMGWFCWVAVPRTSLLYC